MKELGKFLQKIKAEPAGKKILHIHVSCGPTEARTKAKVTAAANFIRGTLEKYGFGDAIIAPNGDILAWYSQIGTPLIQKLLFKMQDHFLGKLSMTKHNFYGEPVFFTMFDANVDLYKVEKFVTNLMMQDVKPQSVGKKPVYVNMLPGIIKTIQLSNLTSAIFNQPVYNISTASMSIEFLEFFVSISNLEEIVCKDNSLTSNRWIFNLITVELDRAVLRHLIRELIEFRHKGFSLNINIQTVRSEDFRKFDEALPAKIKQKMILEINKSDAIENASALSEVSNVMKKLGYRICIDGVDYHSLRMMDLTNMEADFIKLIWSQKFEDLDNDERAEVKNKMKAVPHIDFVLTRCDTAASINFAKELEIPYIQGRLPDKYWKSNIAI